MDKFKQHIANELKRQGWAKEERDTIMTEMKRHLGEKKPEVGSFYYDLKNKKLMLVDTIPMELARDSGNGIKTTDKLHRDITEEYVFSTVDEYFEAVKDEELPVVQDDLQFHAKGCYSACAQIKEAYDDVALVHGEAIGIATRNQNYALQ